ncbi:MAG: cation transporter [Tissierellia bacterium]|nr:cation transporter [Tissierellia bacterium]
MNKVFIEGMTCDHCVASVKEALEKIPGVSNVVVNLEEGFATYEGLASDTMVQKAIEAIGFNVKQEEEDCG